MRERLQFPDGFLWGSATSSHQVEGNNTNNDWWRWEHEPGRIRDGTTSAGAAEWWAGRAEQDLAVAASLGQNAHRFSLEWSRLEPEPGRWEQSAFDRYRAILSEARRLGLKPMLTLNHFTLPAWLADEGGWLSSGVVERFAELARRAARELGEHVELWATLNEPNVLSYMSYAGRRWPPGAARTSSCFRALAQMLRAHARAATALHQVDPAARVGIVLNLPIFDPQRLSRLDRAAAAAQDWAFNGAVLHALERGVLLPPISLRPLRVPGLQGSFDWLGLNYYGRFRVRFDPRAKLELFGRRDSEHTIKTEWTDWGEVHPAGLTLQLMRLSRLGVPLYVTENGVYDNDDSVRPRFIADHVRAVHTAIRRGVDVRGYFVWSLIDNFEWAEGWSAHFGLLELDPATQARKPRKSAETYATICRENAINPP